MKFNKFVKSLASNGVIYNRFDENLPFADKWLASDSVFMLIPPNIRSVTAHTIQDMPEAIDRMISQIGCTQEARLVKAVMPFPEAKIKDCIRIFSTADGQISIPITNDDWSLIEKSDLCEILYAYNLDDESVEAKALLVKQYPMIPNEEEELVGIIFPVEYEN